MPALNKILMTGGSGLLGTEIRKQKPEIQFCDIEQFDIKEYDSALNYIKKLDIDTIFHAAAFTSPPKVDEMPKLAVDSNIIGTANIVKICMKFGFKLIYISTDYVFKGDVGFYKEEDPVYPVNKYAWSKLGGECAARLYDNTLIIRTTFGPDIFPYPKAFIDQWTSRESVSKIASLLISLIEKDVRGVYHVGGNRKTVYEYAKSLNPGKEIGELSINELNFTVPADTSLDCSKFYKTINNN